MSHTDLIPALCGQTLTATQLHPIQEITARYPDLPRTEGRNDRYHRHHQQAPKRVWLYPLYPHSRDQLCQGV